MTMQAQSADGMIHEFPDGTDPAIIDKTMKSYAQGGAPQSAAPAADSSLLGHLKDAAIATNPIGQVYNLANAAMHPADSLKTVDAAVRGAANTASLGLADKFAGFMNSMTGKSKDYASGLDEQRGYDKQAETENPGAYTAGSLAGGFAAPELGLVKGAGMLKGLTEGAFQGGVTGFNNDDGSIGHKIGSGVIDAGLGSAFSTAAPIFSKAGSVVRNVSDLFLDPEGKSYALRKIGEAAQKAGTDVPSAVQGVADAKVTAPDWNMADQLGNPGGRLTRAVINNGSEGAEGLRQQLTDRQLDAGSRVKGAFGDVFGDPAKYQGTVDDAVAGMKTKAKPFYDSAEKTPIDYAAYPELEDMLKQVRDGAPQAIRNANKIMAVEGRQSKQIKITQNPDGSLDSSSLPDVAQWDYIKRGMDKLISDTKGKGAGGGLDTYGRAVTGLKNEVLDTLDQAVPDYGTARQIFKGDADVKNAVETGREALSADPEAIAKARGDMSEAERTAHGIGMSRALGDKIDNVRGTGDVLGPVWNSSAAKARVGAAIQDPAVLANLQEQLGREGAMNRTFTKAGGNSSTAQQISDSADAMQSGAADFGTRVITRGVMNALWGAGTHYARKIGGMNDARAGQLAQDLGGDGSDVLSRFTDSKDREAKLSALAAAFNGPGSQIGRAAALAGMDRR